MAFIETMFMRVCTDKQMQQYVKLVDDGHMSLATAYASNVVFKLFFYLIDQWEKLGGNTEDLSKEVKKNGVKRV